MAAAALSMLLLTPGVPVRDRNGRAGRIAKAATSNGFTFVTWAGEGHEHPYDDAALARVTDLSLDTEALDATTAALADGGGVLGSLAALYADLLALYQASAEAEYTDTDAVWSVVDNAFASLRDTLPVVQAARLRAAADQMQFDGDTRNALRALLA